MTYLAETSVQLQKELQNFFRKYLKELAQLTLIYKTHTIRDHFKYKDKQAHLERCNVMYKLKCSWKLYLFLEHQYQPVSSFLLTAAILVYPYL